MTKRIKMGVVRGTREPVIDFYRKFKKIDVQFIAGSFKRFTYKLTTANFRLKNSLFYKPLMVDPAQLLLNQYGNLSWIFIKNLEKSLEGCDVVNISDTYYFSNLQAVRWAKRNKVPVVTIIWTTIPRHITTWFPPYSFITKKVIDSTSLFILRSRKALSFTDSLMIPREKVKVIYKGVDLDKFAPLKKKKEGEIKILFTGNLSCAKGLGDLLEVYLKLKKEFKKIQLIVAGEGELKSELGKRNNQGIDFKGFVPYGNLPKIYQEADIYCAPSQEKRLFGIKVWEEYFSYSLMEAQACGLPIISTQTGGISEEVGPQNSLIPPGDRQALYRELKELILNERKRSYLGKLNRRRAERLFDAGIQAKKTEEAILKLCHN